MKLSEIVVAWERGERVQVKLSIGWETLSTKEASFIYGYEYRLKPRTMTINGIEFPEPLREPPAEGTRIYVVRIDCGDTAGAPRMWDVNFLPLLQRGLIQATREGAEKQTEALLSLLKSGEVKND